MPDDAKPAAATPASAPPEPAKPAAATPPPATPEPATPATPQSKLGAFIVRYPTFISSLVVGVAGLIATTIWQYRNFHSQRDTAAAQQKIAETQAANNWKIERTEILGKNLQTLAQAGPDTADQRYGVLLSLTRAEIIDPELAVSYALELGKDNVEYMTSVLASAQDKDYARIARAYTLSCDQRYGVAPTIDACNDKLAARSQALADLVADETLAAVATDPIQPGPLVLLKDERRTQLDIVRLSGLFEAALVGMYQRHQFDELAKLEQYSPGAHFVAALAIAAAHTGEFVTDDEARALAQFHAGETKWLADYLASKACDAECKARAIEVMITRYAEAQGDFDGALRKLLAAPRAQSAGAIARLHTRLLWCQVHDNDITPLRDHVLVPAAHDMLRAASDPATRDAVMSLLAVVPEPPASDSRAAAAWTALVAELDNSEAVARTFRERRATALRQRQQPPTQALRKQDFCLVAQPTTAPAATGSAAAATKPAK